MDLKPPSTSTAKSSTTNSCRTKTRSPLLPSPVAKSSLITSVSADSRWCHRQSSGKVARILSCNNRQEWWARKVCKASRISTKTRQNVWPGLSRVTLCSILMYRRWIRRKTRTFSSRLSWWEATLNKSLKTRTQNIRLSWPRKLLLLYLTTPQRQLRQLPKVKIIVPSLSYRIY